MSKTLPGLTASTAPDYTDELVVNYNGNPRRVALADIATLITNCVPVNGALDGATDDTAAFEAAIAAANGYTPRKPVIVNGYMKFTPSTNQIPNNTTIYVNGTLKPTGGDKTIYLGAGCKLIGLGGAEGLGAAIQFSHDKPVAGIIPPDFVSPVLGNRDGAEGITIENFRIYNCFAGISLTSPALPAALTTIRNVNIRVSETNGYCINIDQMFWVWVKDCALLADGTTSNVFLINNTDFDPGDGISGLIYIEDIVGAGNGSQILGASSTTVAGNIYVKNYHHESIPAGGVLWYIRNANRITFDQVGVSDALGSYTGYDVDSSVSALRILNTDRAGGLFTNSVFPVGYMMEITNKANASGSVYNLGHKTLKRSLRVIDDGEFDERPVWRAPGEPVLNMGNVVAITPITSGGGGITVTTGQLAPDGSSTALLLTVTGAGTNWINSSFDIDGGDHIIIFGWFKSAVSGTGVLGESLLACSGLTLTGTLAFTYGTGSPSTFYLNAMARQWADAGWFPAYGLTPVTGSKSGNSNLAFGTQVSSGQNFYCWKTGYSIVKSAQGYDTATLVHHMNSIGAMVPGAANGVIALQDHQTFRTGSGTSANRPIIGVGVGSKWYDTTLGMPIWASSFDVPSGKWIWKDALGTTKANP